MLDRIRKLSDTQQGLVIAGTLGAIAAGIMVVIKLLA